MRTLTKSMVFCNGCERNQPIEHDSALRRWRYIWIRRRDNVFMSTRSAHPDDLGMTYLPGNAKLVCCDEGAAKLFSRWLNSGTLDAPKGNVAEPIKPTLFEQPSALEQLQERTCEIVDRATEPPAVAGGSHALPNFMGIAGDQSRESEDAS